MKTSGMLAVATTGEQNRTSVAWWRQLNKLRWLSLSLIFAMLILLPFLHLYQIYLAAHAYDLLTPGELLVFHSMEWLTSPFTDDPAVDLDHIKGSTWSGSLFGLQLSDPLAAVAQVAAGKTIYWPLLLTIIIPIGFTLVAGRFFCGWICPATLLYELNDNLGTWLQREGFPIGQLSLDRRWKYLLLILGLVLSAVTGVVLFAYIYPPAIIGREIYYAIALSGFGAGAVLFLCTMLFDLFVTRRGFCRYICPGGALYSLLGRYRLLRIKRDVSHCNDCAKCNTVCQFGLDPQHDDFGQECNNCSACIAICSTNALVFTASIKDDDYQGPGQLGHHYKNSHRQSIPSINTKEAVG